MTKTFQITVHTPEAEVVNKPAVSIKISTEMGPMVMYAHHASLTGSVPFSRFFVRDEKGEAEYLVKNGILFISLENNAAKVLCYSCQEMKDITYETAEEYLRFVEEQLKKGADLNEFQLKFLQNEKIAMVKQIQILKNEE